MKKTFSIKTLAIIFLIQILSLGTASGNPVSAQGAGPDVKLISDQSLLTIDTIQISGSTLQMECKFPLEMDQQTFMARLLTAMYLSSYNRPNVSQISVLISFMEKPFSLLSVSKENVIAAYTEQMDPQEFLDTMIIEDRRPTQSIFFDELYKLGITLNDFSIDGNQLYIKYFSEPIPDKLTVFEDWIFILNLTANLYPQIQETTIDIFVPKNLSQVITTINMDEYNRYTNGQINILDFMTTLKFSYGAELNQAVQGPEEIPAKNPPQNHTNSILGTVFCSGIFFLLFLIGLGIGLYLLITKKSTLWGIILIILVAIPSYILMMIFIGSYIYNNG
ncbi:MAG: hypothetical protein CL609_00545 [Anaerolineaceae bacterium]|nr:hypothetical protein [Anaerolineaceae bacterium]